MINENLEQIKRIPKKLNLSLDKILLCGESPIYYKGVLVREPDGLIFDPTTKLLYNIECKRTNNARNRKLARHQLYDCKHYLDKIFRDWQIVNLYVSGNGRIEEISF